MNILPLWLDFTKDKITTLKGTSVPVGGFVIFAKFEPILTLLMSGAAPDFSSSITL